MGGYDNFKLRTALDGANSREAKINDARHILALEFTNDPSYCDSMYHWIPGVNSHIGDKVDIRLFGRKYSSANGYTTQFEVQVGDKPDIGDYYFEKELNQYWICTELHNVNHIHVGGKLTMCNWFLRWQNDTGEVIEYPCNDINSTQYNSGEAGDKTMTLGSAQHMATVQATPDTIDIRSPLRFFVSRDYTIPFKVTQNDTVSNNYGNGLCKITLTQDQLNLEVDRPDLGLCDYKPLRPLPPKPDDISNLSAVISGNNKLKCGFDRDYSVKFMDNKGEYHNNVEFSWNVISDFNVSQKINDNMITLQVNDENYIGSSFLLQVIVNEVVLSEITIDVIEAF